MRGGEVPCASARLRGDAAPAPAARPRPAFCLQVALWPLVHHVLPASAWARRWPDHRAVRRGGRGAGRGMGGGYAPCVRHITRRRFARERLKACTRLSRPPLAARLAPRPSPRRAAPRARATPRHLAAPRAFSLVAAARHFTLKGGHFTPAARNSPPSGTCLSAVISSHGRARDSPAGRRTNNRIASIYCLSPLQSTARGRATPGGGHTL